MSGNAPRKTRKLSRQDLQNVSEILTPDLMQLMESSPSKNREFKLRKMTSLAGQAAGMIVSHDAARKGIAYWLRNPHKKGYERALVEMLIADGRYHPSARDSGKTADELGHFESTAAGMGLDEEKVMQDPATFDAIKSGANGFDDRIIGPHFAEQMGIPPHLARGKSLDELMEAESVAEALGGRLDRPEFWDHLKQLREAEKGPARNEALTEIFDYWVGVANRERQKARKERYEENKRKADALRAELARKGMTVHDAFEKQRQSHENIVEWQRKLKARREARNREKEKPKVVILDPVVIRKEIERREFPGGQGYYVGLVFYNNGTRKVYVRSVDGEQMEVLADGFDTFPGHGFLGKRRPTGVDAAARPTGSRGPARSRAPVGRP